MPSRKFSAEQRTSEIHNTDLVPLTRDPDGGTPASWVAPAAVWREYLLTPAPVPAGDIGAHTLPDGGTVAAATVTPISGASQGFVDDILEFSITDPTPGMVPCVVVFPIALEGAIPPHATIRLNNVPRTVLHDHQSGLLFGSDNNTSLALVREFAVTPPSDYELKMLELDALSGDLATWESSTLTYANTCQQEISLRTVMPFAAMPQVALEVENFPNALSGSGTRNVFIPLNAASGTFNDSGAWTGATLTTLSFVVVISTAYVGTLTFQIQLAKNF